MSRQSEYGEAAQRMFRDLVAAGIGRGAAFYSIIFYLAALRERNEMAWARFYRDVAERLCAAAERGPLPRRAISVRALLDDDFGRLVVAGELRARMNAALVERRVREASLSS